MFLTKTKQGYFIPSDDSTSEWCKKLPIGEEVKISKPRNSLFHRKAFALLNLGFENQDKYQTLEIYRKILTIRAGYYDEVPNKNGEPYYIPKSLSYESMSAENFDKWYNDTLNLISSDMKTLPETITQELNSFY